MYEAIGKEFGLWTVLDKSSYRAANGNLLYKCRCQKCGNISYLKLSNIKRSKGRNCSNCTPNYNFSICGDVATGTLPDGTQFTVDAEDTDKVSKYRWFYHKNTGYISSQEVEGATTALHRFVLNLRHSDYVVVDHINRQKTDCKKGNLRIVTVAQNTLNKTLRRSSKTGYMGVGYERSSKLYCAKIQIGHNALLLGKSLSSEKCAQMYNIASEILFGEFGGQKNDVSEPSLDMVERITLLCQPLLPCAQELTKPVYKTRGG